MEETPKLTEEELTVIDGFAEASAHFKIPLEIGLPTVLCLKTPEQQLEMLQYFGENWDKELTNGQVVAKVEEILTSSER